MASSLAWGFQSYRTGGLLSNSAGAGHLSSGWEAYQIGYRSGEPDSAEIEAFISDNGLDEMASRKIRELSTDLQTLLLAQGPLGHLDNPSSAVMSRIRRLAGSGGWVVPPLKDHSTATRERARRVSASAAERHPSLGWGVPALVSPLQCTR